MTQKPDNIVDGLGMIQDLLNQYLADPNVSEETKVKLRQSQDKLKANPLYEVATLVHNKGDHK